MDPAADGALQTESPSLDVEGGEMDGGSFEPLCEMNFQ